METNELMKLLTDTGALLTGHFRLSSGKHSDKYIQCALLLQWPEYAAIVASEIRKLFNDKKINIVIGPAIGGITLAYETARAFKARGLWTERKNDKMILARGFKIQKGENVLVVEDVITTGGSVGEVIELVEEMEGNIVGVSSIINRANATDIKGYPFKSLLKVDFKTFEPDSCPLCEKGFEIYSPGSRNRI